MATSGFYHQLYPENHISLDPYQPLPQQVRQQLRERGYSVRPQSWDLGDVQLIYVTPAGVEAVSDPRGRGASKVLN